MKILSIRGHHLASLEQVFDIRFDESPLRDSPLIAITGKTGSGKSTILDAMCLALYDRIPRFHQRGGAKIETLHTTDDIRAFDVRQIVRKGATEAEAEVIFKGQHQQCYRVLWQVRRARSKSGGKLQAQTVRLFNETLQQELSASTKTETLKRIEACVGLSYEQFCQSALLAQGEFANFLKADSKLRATLLERITGTSIYKHISKRCHERALKEGEQLAFLQIELAALKVLEPAALKKLEHERTHCMTAISQREQQLHVLQKMADWQIREQFLQGEHQRLQHEWDALAQAFLHLEQEKIHLQTQRLFLPLQQQSQSIERIEKELYEIETQLFHLREEKIKKEKMIADDQSEMERLHHSRDLSASTLEKNLSWDPYAHHTIENTATQLSQLTEYRALLEEHIPCPLCGSLEHPYQDETVLKAHQFALQKERQTFEAQKVARRAEQHALQQIEKKIQDLTSRHHQKQKGFAESDTRIHMLLSQQEKLRQERNILSAALTETLKKNEWAIEHVKAMDQALDAHDIENRLRLIEKKEHQRIEVKALLQASKMQLEHHLQEQPQDTHLSEERLNVAQCSAFLKEKRQQLYTLEQEIITARHHHITAQKLTERIAQQEKKYVLWHRMKQLIGSSDGSKLNTFAQQMNCDLLLHFANQHLARLESRYSLKSNRFDALTLEVVDHDLGNEIRPAESLSGGETFIISLALALALSDLSSQDTPIESLFIDEGFGALDETSLDHAISCLESLTHQGKQVVIISHISELKDRIQQKIEIRETPSSGSLLHIPSGLAPREERLSPTVS